MATTAEFRADMERWSQDQKDSLEYIVKDAAQTVFEAMTQRQPSSSETVRIDQEGVQRAVEKGFFEEGKVPVDTGFLVGTSELRINGGTVGSGSVAGKSSTPPDFAAGLAGMEIGDTVEAVFTAPYARRMEYGFTGTDSAGRTYNQPGRHFVRDALGQWQAIVDASAAKFKDL